MIGNRKWKVSSTNANINGLKTTVTISTEDETVVRKILQEPTAENAKAKKEDSMNAEFKSASSKNSSKKQIKQLAVPNKPGKQQKTIKQKSTKKQMNRNLLGKLSFTQNSSKKSTVNNKTSNKASKKKKTTQPSGNDELYYGRFLIIQHPGRSWDLIDTKDPRYNPNKKESSGIISSIYDFGTSTLSQIIHEFDEKMQEVLNEKNN